MLPVAALTAFWPFASGWMLLWGLAALAPLVIHWLSRRRYRETSWAATRFLLAALKENARRLRLEQLLLLLLRMLVLILLAIALAEPQLQSPTTAQQGPRRGTTHWLIVLDGSLSMNYRPETQTHFQQGQELARQLIADAQQGDGFSLLLMASPPQVVIGEPAFDAGDVQREIDALELRHGGADLLATLTETQRLVEQARRRQPRLQDARVCFLTDFGRTTWDALDDSAVRRALGQLERDGVQLVLLEIGQRSWHNAAVTQLQTLDAMATVDRDVRFLAEITRFSADQPRRMQAEVRIDGQTVREEAVDLTTGTSVLSFAHRFAAPGDHHVEVRIADDPLELDNQRWHVVSVRQSLAVLCIEGSPGAARYVAYALEPRRTEQPLVRWEIAPESVLLERELKQYDCIFLCNVARFSNEEARVLERYVAGGGSIVVTLGDQVDLENYNRYLADADNPLLPAELVEVVSTGVHMFDPLDYEHPLVKPFENQPRAGLLTVPTWRYVKLRPLGEDRMRTALAVDNGDPVLVDALFGRGRVFLLATAASPSAGADLPEQAWSELATWPSFPPLVQEMLAAALRHRDAERQVVVGQPLSGIAPQPTAATSLTITRPDGSAQRVPLARENELVQWMYADTYLSGLYEAKFELPDQQQWYSVLPQLDESQLDRSDPASLPAQFARQIEEPASTANAAPGTSNRSLVQIAVAALLVVLLAESFFAWRFGSKRL